MDIIHALIGISDIIIAKMYHQAVNEHRVLRYPYVQ